MSRRIAFIALALASFADAALSSQESRFEADAATGVFLDPGASACAYVSVSLGYFPIEGLMLSGAFSGGFEPPSYLVPASGTFTLAASARYALPPLPWLGFELHWSHLDRPAWLASENALRLHAQASFEPGWRVALGVAFLQDRIGLDYSAGSFSFGGAPLLPTPVWAIDIPLLRLEGHALLLSFRSFDDYLSESPSSIRCVLRWQYVPGTATPSSAEAPDGGDASKLGLTVFAELGGTLRGLSGLSLSAGGYRMEGGVRYAW